MGGAALADAPVDPHVGVRDLEPVRLTAIPATAQKCYILDIVCRRSHWAPVAGDATEEIVMKRRTMLTALVGTGILALSACGGGGATEGGASGSGGEGAGSSAPAESSAAAEKPSAGFPFEKGEVDPKAYADAATKAEESLTSYREDGETTSPQGTSTTKGEFLKDPDGTARMHYVQDLGGGLGTSEMIVIGDKTWSKTGDGPWEEQQGLAMTQQDTSDMLSAYKDAVQSVTYDGEDETGHKFTLAMKLGEQEMTVPVWHDDEMRTVRTEVSLNVGDQEMTMVRTRSDFNAADISIEPPM